MLLYKVNSQQRQQIEQMYQTSPNREFLRPVKQKQNPNLSKIQRENEIKQCER